VTFVHDPKLKGASEVVAQVRIKLRNVTGQSFWATRVSKVKLLPKGKRTFASIECKLEMGTGDQKRESIATTNNAVTVGIADLMGVSTAVLEYVIFCHQEESNWPLGEPKELKTRFDDIFAVSRYTKAMDEIKKARKKFMGDIKVLEEQLKVHSMRRQQRAALLEEIDSKEKQRAELNADVDNATFSVNKLIKEKRHLMDTIKTLQHTFEELKRLKTLEAQSQQFIAQFGQSQNEFSELALDELLKRKENLSLQNTDDEHKKEELEMQIEDFKRRSQQIEDRRLMLTHNHASANEWAKRIDGVMKTLTKATKEFIQRYAKVFKDSPFSTPDSIPSKAALADLTGAVDIAKAGREKITNAMATSGADGAKRLVGKVSAMETKTSRVAELRGSEAGLSTRLSILDSDIFGLNEEVEKMRSASQTMKQYDRTVYEEKQRQLQEMEIEALLPQLEIEIHQAEAHLAILDHHADVIGRWTQYKFSVASVESNLEHLLKTQTAFDKKLTQQLPLLNDSLPLFTPYTPPGGDIFSRLSANPSSSPALTMTHIQDPAFLIQLLDCLDVRAKLAKKESDAEGESEFNWNSKLSSTTFSITKLDGEQMRAKKTLESKKESFERKLRQLKGVDVAVFDEIVAFFRKDPSQASLGDDDDVLLLESSTPPYSLVARMPDELVVYQSLVSAAKENLQRIETRLAVLKTSRDMYESLLEKSMKHANCTLCQRPFKDPESWNVMEDNIKSMTALLPTQVSDANREHAHAQSLITSLEALLPQWQEICTIYSQYPLKESQISQLRTERLVLTDSLAQARDRAETTAQKYKQLVNIQNNIATLHKEVIGMEETNKQIQEQIAKREAVQKPHTEPPTIVLDPRYEHDGSVVSFLDYDQLPTMKSADINTLADSMRNLQKSERSKLVALKTRQSSLDSLRRDCESYIQRYQAEFQKAVELNAQLAISEEKLVSLQSEADSSRVSLEALQSQLRIEIEELEELKAAKAELSEELEARSAKFSAQTAEYNSHLTHLLSSYDEAVKLERNLADVDATEFESEMERLREELDALRTTSRECEVQLALLNNRDDSSRRRALQDAIQYRTIMSQLENVERQISNQNELANGQTLEQLQAKIEELDKAIEKEKHHRSSHLGMIEGIGKDVANKRRELNAQLSRHLGYQAGSSQQHAMDVTMDVDSEWKKAYVQLETTKMASEDLAVSLDALDKSLMKYHSTKMADINQILKELWENTYKGNDIDYVKIVAENEDGTPHTATATSASAKSQKNFNYRVVMVKGGVELDMRGSCSAGQKVLASLMIRMALAETFCLNCGILALDEPTSNLDQANVESLAESLRNVIETRQKQSNFQIIVITHDEEFVKVIGRNSWTDEYYKVKKNNEQHTVITKKSIRELK